MKVLSENKRATHAFEIQERVSAGLVLLGHEVKSARMGRFQLTGSYIVPKGQEFWLVGATIPPYQPKNTPLDYDPGRSRKLLLQKQEIQTLLGKSQTRGLTLVPLRVYSADHGTIKLDFALARGKKQHDKRQSIKKREAEREMRAALKDR